MTDLGEVSSFLGAEINRDRASRKILLSQAGYADRMLSKFGMKDCRSASAPGSAKSHHTGASACGKEAPHREAVGSLLCLSTKTRADIAASVGVTALHIERPLQSDWADAKRTLRHVKGALDYSLALGAQNCENPTLEGCSDADWGGDKKDRKSVSGFIIQACNSSASWKSIKQAAVALPAAEAECVALSGAAKEASWLRRVMTQLGHPQNVAAAINEGNQPCIAWAYSDGSSKRAKRIALRHHCSKDMAQKGEIKLQHCPTDRMLADMLTKPLGSVKFESFRSAIGALNGRDEGK